MHSMDRTDSDVYTRCLLKRRVKLPATLQNRHASDSIVEILRQDVEGVCGADGFVRPRSVSVVDVSPGIIEMTGLSGSAVYNVRFTADVCNPCVGDILTCRVVNVNSYGVLAVNMSDTSVLEVILQREPVSFEHAESLDGVEPGDSVTLEVMCRHFKLGQKTITLIGRAVSKDARPTTFVGAEDDDDDDAVADDGYEDLEDAELPGPDGRTEDGDEDVDAEADDEVADDGELDDDDDVEVADDDVGTDGDDDEDDDDPDPED